jgi:hypothetical protein
LTRCGPRWTPTSPGSRLRFRTSTNSEDLDGFPCAGCYESHTGDPADWVDVLDAIRETWASIWLFRTFEERAYNGIDHSSVVMALLVHHNFPDEEANGVAITANPFDPPASSPASTSTSSTAARWRWCTRRPAPPAIRSSTCSISPGQPDHLPVALQHRGPRGQTVLEQHAAVRAGPGPLGHPPALLPRVRACVRGPRRVGTRWTWSSSSTTRRPGEVPKLLVKQARPVPGARNFGRSKPRRYLQTKGPGARRECRPRPPTTVRRYDGTTESLHELVRRRRRRPQAAVQAEPRLGLFLAAPLVVGTLWYAWSSYTTVERYRRAVDDKGSVGLELFQVALHDELVRDLRALTLGERPVVGRLPTYELSLSPADVDLLTAQLGAKGAKTYAKGLLRVDGGVHEVEVRYRGEQPWHSLGVQKSMKIKVDRGDLVDGMRVFNLLNDPTPFGLEDQIILDLARDSGLLTPDYRPVRVRINNHDMGVYRLESQPDESLIRQNHRIPGNMYAGDAEKLRGDQAFGPLFTSTAGWTKLADRSEARAAEVAELVRFVDAVHHASHLQSSPASPRRELDLPRWARFDALDVTFGGERARLPTPTTASTPIPYRGKLEPVAWSFRGFQRDAGFNLRRLTRCCCG